METDTEEEMTFLCCPFNRYRLEKHLFRSPWSSNYFPVANKGSDFKEKFGEPYQELAMFEKRANELFNFYAELYHNGSEGLSTSFYVIDYERDEYIEGIFLLKKTDKDSLWSTSHHFKISYSGSKLTVNCFSAIYAKIKINDVEVSYKNDCKVENMESNFKFDTKVFVSFSIQRKIKKQYILALYVNFS